LIKRKIGTKSLISPKVNFIQMQSLKSRWDKREWWREVYDRVVHLQAI